MSSSMLHLLSVLFCLFFQNRADQFCCQRYQLLIEITAKLCLFSEHHGPLLLRRTFRSVWNRTVIGISGSGKCNHAVKNFFFQPFCHARLLRCLYQLCVMEHIRDIRAVPGRAAMIDGQIQIKQIRIRTGIQFTSLPDELHSRQPEQIFLPGPLQGTGRAAFPHPALYETHYSTIIIRIR